MTKEELQEIQESLLRRDDAAVNDMNNGRYPGIEGRVEFTHGRALDALLILNKILEHLIAPDEPLKR